MKEKKISMLIILSILITSTAMAGNGATETLTVTPTGTPTVTQTQTAVATETQMATETPMQVKKFRVGPTVRLRPLNDEITRNTDGLVELYMDNPSLNDVTLTVDARVSVPAGIHVFGQGFGEAGAAGTVYGVFEVPPGKARTIYITIKAEKVGDFSAQFSGTYYPEDNKDEFQPLSLTHPFKVNEASENPTQESPPQTEEEQKPASRTPGLTVVMAILAFTIAVYGLRRN
jgi:hypothetical protein